MCPSRARARNIGRSTRFSKSGQSSNTSTHSLVLLFLSAILDLSSLFCFVGWKGERRNWFRISSLKSPRRGAAKKCPYFATPLVFSNSSMLICFCTKTRRQFSHFLEPCKRDSLASNFTCLLVFVGEAYAQKKIPPPRQKGIWDAHHHKKTGGRDFPLFETLGRSGAADAQKGPWNEPHQLSRFFLCNRRGNLKNISYVFCFLTRDENMHDFFAPFSRFGKGTHCCFVFFGASRTSWEPAAYRGLPNIPFLRRFAQSSSPTYNEKRKKYGE